MSYSLGDILGKRGYIRGPFGSSLRRGEMLDQGIPVYEQLNAIHNNREFRYFIDENKFQELERFKVEEGDVLISCSGTVGKTTIIKTNDPLGIISQALLILRPNRELMIPEFLKYFLDSKVGQERLISRSHGSVQTNIAKRSDVETLQLPNLSLEVQKKVVSILSSLDDKIELNNKINKTLEELAQTLYKHWLIDFEFPNEEGKPYKSSGGEMVESEIGIIPKEWNVTHLDDLFDFERGIEPGSKNYSETKTEGHIPFIRVGDLESTPKIYVDTSLVKDKTCKPDDVMISFDGAIGRVGIGLSGAYSTGIRKVTSKNNDIGFSFIYGLVKSQNIQDQILTYANGTTILHAGSSIKHLVMPFNLGAVLKLEQILQPLMKKILNNFDENRNLEALRDTLLPRLMSGEIEV
jgi:type I restriction enzyme S subunit